MSDFRIVEFAVKKNCKSAVEIELPFMRTSAEAEISRNPFTAIKCKPYSEITVKIWTHSLIEII